MTAVDLSVVIPVYNSARILPALTSEIDTVLCARFSRYEIIFVNDGSRDGSAAVLNELAQNRSYVKSIYLKNNGGQQEATLTGLRAAAGKIVVTMDDDGQHDPRDIPRLVKEIENGADLAYAVSEKAQGGRIRQIGAALRDAFFRFAFRKQKGLRLSSFRAMSGDLCARIKADRAWFPYISAMAFRHDIRAVNIPAQFRTRKEGQSGYHILKLAWIYLKLVACYGPVRFGAAGKGGRRTSKSS